MSEEKQETISDIVAEIRAKNPERRYPAEYGGGVVDDEMRTLDDRIEAAYNQLPLLTTEQWMSIAQQAGENYDLKRENVRLRAALRPVLEVDIPTDECVDSHDECECPWCCAGDTECWRGKGMIVMNAVREARRIYNESMESEVNK